MIIWVYSLHVLVVDLRLEFCRVCSRRCRPPPHPARAGPRVANLGASCQGQHNEEINLLRERGDGSQSEGSQGLESTNPCETAASLSSWTQTRTKRELLSETLVWDNAAAKLTLQICNSQVSRDPGVQTIKDGAKQTEANERLHLTNERQQLTIDQWEWEAVTFSCHLSVFKLGLCPLI